MKSILRMIVLVMLLGFGDALLAQMPQIITYQGRVSVNGTNFTGTGQFKFALVNYDGTTTYWSNDGTSSGGSQPTTAVSVAVTNGLFTVGLGDNSLAHMTQPVAYSVFANSDVQVRIWFNNGVLGFQQLNPDQRITAAGYAMYAANVSANSDLTGGRLNIGVANTLTGSAATIAGGQLNTASQLSASVGGGSQNSATNRYATVSGGSKNTAGGLGAFVGGGGQDDLGNLWGNFALGSASVVAGGIYNSATNRYSAVVGGYHNIAGGIGSFIGGGSDNLASGTNATIPGGQNNVATNLAFAAGRRAKANHPGAFVWADSQNTDFTSSGTNQFLIRASGGVGIGKTNPATTLDVNGTITGTGFSGNGSGLTNVPVADLAVTSTKIAANAVTTEKIAANAVMNTQLADYAVYGIKLADNCVTSNKLADGSVITAKLADFAVTFPKIAGGSIYDQHINALADIDAGKIGHGDLKAARLKVGINHTLGNSWTTIAGGTNNKAYGLTSAIGGGVNNAVLGEGATIGGGAGNYAGGSGDNWFGTIGGGLDNRMTNAPYSTIPGGRLNQCGSSSGNAYYSFAAGYRAKALYGGTFVWADSTEANFESSAGNQFCVRATGGVRIETGNSDMSIKGNLTILSRTNGNVVVQLGEGLDYAEGFDLSEGTKAAPGTVLVIDPQHPGKLMTSQQDYDKRVAGIVAGGNGLASGVRLGAGQFEHSVALAGRVYCNIDTAYGAVSPGDLLTTSPTPGHAMVVQDYAKAQGAILGKAMESLPLGHKGQILVLVTLQ